MRLISQDGMIDIPYENVCVSINYRNKNQITAWNFGCEDCEIATMATYSTETKALKVMDMLREQYEYGKKISVPQLEESGIAEDDDVMLFNTRLINDYFKGGTYLPVKLFKFPEDSEVEV